MRSSRKDKRWRLRKAEKKKKRRCRPAQRGPDKKAGSESTRTDDKKPLVASARMRNCRRLASKKYPSKKRTAPNPLGRRIANDFMNWRLERRLDSVECPQEEQNRDENERKKQVASGQQFARLARGYSRLSAEFRSTNGSVTAFFSIRLRSPQSRCRQICAYC